MNDDMKAPSAESVAAAALQDVRPLDEPVDPVEVAESIPEEVEGAGEVIRRSAELTMEQARESYDRMRQAAEEATTNIEAAVAAATAGVTELNLKAIEAMKTSTEAAFEFVRALADAKSFEEVVSLQAEHMRKQFDAMNAEAKEFAELAGKVSSRTIAPLNETLGKAFGSAA